MEIGQASIEVEKRCKEMGIGQASIEVEVSRQLTKVVSGHGVTALQNPFRFFGNRIPVRGGMVLAARRSAHACSQIGALAASPEEIELSADLDLGDPSLEERRSEIPKLGPLEIDETSSGGDELSLAFLRSHLASCASSHDCGGGFSGSSSDTLVEAAEEASSILDVEPFVGDSMWPGQTS